MATRVRDWATVDYYSMLGVDVDASGDEIARAFRTAAKRSHPDATDDPDAAEQFKDLAAAYTVLSDRRTRRDYDHVRAMSTFPEAVRAPSAPAAPAAPAPPRRTKRWSRRRAWFALVGGIVVAVLGVVASVVTWDLHSNDAARRARFVPVTADRLDNGDIAFTTRDGRSIVTREPAHHGEGSTPGPTVSVRYDPKDPQHVILDASTFARDITLAIVAIKLLVGGIVFAVLGALRLRRPRVT